MRRKNRDQIKDLERRVKRLEEDVSFLSGIILIDHVRTIKNSPMRERWKRLFASKAPEILERVLGGLSGSP